jgi:hypothetical protein
MGDSGPTGKFKLETSNILNKKYSMKCSKNGTHTSWQITPGGHYSKCETKWKLDSCGLSLPGRANNLKRKMPFPQGMSMCPQASSLGGGHFGYLEKEDPRLWIQAIWIFWCNTYQILMVLIWLIGYFQLQIGIKTIEFF